MFSRLSDNYLIEVSVLFISTTLLLLLIFSSLSYIYLEDFLNLETGEVFFVSIESCQWLWIYKWL